MTAGAPRHYPGREDIRGGSRLRVRGPRYLSGPSRRLRGEARLRGGDAARCLLLGTLLAVAALSMPTAQAGDYEDAIQSFRGAEETAPFFESAYGYAVFPIIGKGGIGVGGAHGSGRVYAQGQYVGDTTMTQFTAGFQLGVQAYSQMIFLEDRRAFDSFTSGNFEFSAQATAVVITAGVSAEANTGGGTTAGASGGRNDARVTHGGYRKGMAVFTIARGGLMFEASLGGQKFGYTPLP